MFYTVNTAHKVVEILNIPCNIVLSLLLDLFFYSDLTKDHSLIRSNLLCSRNFILLYAFQPRIFFTQNANIICHCRHFYYTAGTTSTKAAKSLFS